MSNENHENYRFFIETEWKDIHHSRIQEWSALGVVAATHIGLIQLLKFINKSSDQFEKVLPYLVLTCCLIALLFCVLGILMTCRHRRIMSEKLNWIFEAEDRLGLIKRRVDSIRPRNDEGIIPLNAKMENKTENSTKSSTRIWDKLLWPRFLSTSWLIIAFYFLLGVIDLGFLIISFVLL